MARKAPEQTNVVLHLAGWALGTPALLAAAAAGIFNALGAPSHETLTVATLAGVVGIIIGLPLGIASFLIVRGARGWGQHFEQQRSITEAATHEAHLVEQVQDELAEHLQRPQVHPDAQDPWNGANPYGCCQDNRDPDGNLSHGSPDCLHPFILEQRHPH